MNTILVIHGPNLNLLGTREPEIYGAQTLVDVNQRLQVLASELGLALESFQSNHEGELVDAIQQARGRVSAIIINPACVDPDDVEMLQDLVLTAVNEALRTATKTVEDEIGKITGGLGLGL